MKLEASDRVVIIVGAILLFISAYGIFGVSQESMNRSGLYPLAGHVDSVLGDVRLRDPEKSHYVDISPNMNVYQSDRVFTGENSKTVIELFDSFTLSLQEKSLIIITGKMGEPRIHLDHGKFQGQLKSSQPVVLEFRDKEMILEGDNSTVEVWSEGANSYPGVRAIKGSVKVKIEGKTHILKEGEKIQLEGKGLFSGGLTVKWDKNREKNKPPSLNKKVSDTSQNSKAKVRAVEPNATVSIGTYPYPKRKTVFLHKKGGVIFVAPKRTCDRPCHLVIFIDSENRLEEDFDRGQRPIAQMSIGQGMSGWVEWTLQEQGELPLKGQFEVRPHSTDFFKQALSGGKPIEILD
ncbi:MAG: hypothetical protein H6624_16960 [Bdellovibrionaceae bacterium]|nr:hypothetical protein [Pseudobdellovibrionaceae bacterium]